MNVAIMQHALHLSEHSVIDMRGGPFGAVITRAGEIVATGQNAVTRTHDPTAHAEIVAIRQACQRLNTFNLKGCELYTSCEPCPMCLSACYWAHLDAVYYANNKQVAASAGFDDAFIYDELKREPAERHLCMQHMTLAGADKAFILWQENTEKIPY